MEASLVQNPVVIWFVTGVILVLAEFVLPGLVIVFFGIGALVVSVLLLVFKFSLFWQLLLFTVISVLLLVILRKKNQAQGNSDEERAEEFKGMKVEVKETIPVGGYGKVLFKGALWKAESDIQQVIPAGTWMEIESYNSIILKVKKTKA